MQWAGRRAGGRAVPWRPGAQRTFRRRHSSLCKLQLAHQGRSILTRAAQLPRRRPQCPLQLPLAPPLALRQHPQLPNLLCLPLRLRLPSPSLGAPAGAVPSGWLMSGMGAARQALAPACAAGLYNK